MTFARKEIAAAEQESLAPDGDLVRLWEAWCAGEEPVYERLLARAAELPPEQLVQLLIVEQQRRWRQGDRVRAEIFFEQFPGLKSHRVCAVDLVYGEFLLESDVDGPPSVGNYLERFAEFREELQRQFDVAQGLGEKGQHRTPGATLSQFSVAQRGTDKRAGEPPEGEGQPHVFGDYELLAEIATGGMGVVYKARQRSLNRLVALKMIRSGRLGDPSNVERFYTEAKAAANLQHPHIVAVHEVGEHAGQHFFSMDFVQGATLAEMVREHALPPRRAAKYVKTVAETMQFAHQHGVLHRDLKPANVLVNESDEPLITDFGLAKQLEHQSHLTIEGLVLGTPSYMPPEQATGQIQEVEPRSDVYSLGATLYELLTGRPPFRAANPYDTIRQVCDIEPVSPRLLNPGVPRDLETICLKCLQKEKARRYASAQELADELGRFLADQPILARPASWLERTWRWCHRNPSLATAVGLAAIGLCGAVVSLSWGYLSTKAALATAERRLNQTRTAIDELFTLVAEETLLNEPGLQPLRKELLLKAHDLYQDVLAEEGNDPRIRHDLSVSYFRLGRIMEEIGSPQEALQPLDKARSMQEALSLEQPDDPALQYDLANTWNALGTVLSSLRRYDEARPWLQRAHDARRALVDNDPANREHLRKLANILMNLGSVDEGTANLEAARNRMEAAQQLRLNLLAREPQSQVVRRDLAKGYYNLAQVAIALRDRAHSNGDESALAANHERAMQDLDRAIGQFEKLLADNPRSLADRYDLVACCRRKADETLVREEEEALYDRARRQMQSLADANPDVHEYQARLAGIQFQIGVFYADKDEEKSLEAYRQAREKLTPLVERYPNIPDYRADLAATLLEIGRHHYRRGQLNEAADVATQSLTHFQRLLDRFAGQSKYQGEFAESRDLLAQIARRYFDRSERTRAIECVERCIRLDPHNEQLRELRKRFQGGATEH